MALRELIGGGLDEISGVLAREGTLATINGRSFPVVLESIARAKPLASGAIPVGFSEIVSAVFIVRKTYLSGHTVDSLENKLITFESKSYRIINTIDNGLSFRLETEAETGKR